MVNIYIARFSTLTALKALYNFASQSPIHTHTHTYWRRRSCLARRCSAHWEQFRFFLNDTSAHGLGGVRDRTVNLAISRRPSLPPEPQPPHMNAIMIFIGSLFHLDKDSQLLFMQDIRQHFRHYLKMKNTSWLLYTVCIPHTLMLHAWCLTLEL